MLCQNTSKTATARFSIDGIPGRPPHRYEVPPGAKVEIPDGYCKPYRARAKKTKPPIITQICPMMRPCPGEYAPGVMPPTQELRDASPTEIAGILSEMRSAMANQQMLIEQLKAERSGGAEAEALRAETERLRAELAELRGGTPEPAEPAPAPAPELSVVAEDETVAEEDPEDDVDSEFFDADADADAGAMEAAAKLDAEVAALKRLKKDELTAQATELGLHLDGSETKEDLAEAIAAHKVARGE